MRVTVPTAREIQQKSLGTTALMLGLNLEAFQLMLEKSLTKMVLALDMNLSFQYEWAKPERSVFNSEKALELLTAWIELGLTALGYSKVSVDALSDHRTYTLSVSLALI